MSEEYKNFNEYTEPEAKEEKTEKAEITVNEEQTQEDKDKKGGLMKGIIALIAAYASDLIPSAFMMAKGVDTASYLSNYLSGDLDSTYDTVMKIFAPGAPLYVMVGGMVLLSIFAIVLANKSMKKCSGGRKVPAVIAKIVAIFSLVFAGTALIASFLTTQM